MIWKMLNLDSHATVFPIIYLLLLKAIKIINKPIITPLAQLTQINSIQKYESKISVRCCDV